MEAHTKIKGLTRDEYDAMILAARITKLLATMARMDEAWTAACYPDDVHLATPEEPYTGLDYHNIAEDYKAVCDLTAREIATNDREARNLVEAVAHRWGVDITIDGIDTGGKEE